MNNIKIIRELKKIGLNELSRMSGVNASYISALERGEKKNPTMTTLNKIAIALNVTVDELLRCDSIANKQISYWDLNYKHLKESNPYEIIQDMLLNPNMVEEFNYKRENITLFSKELFQIIEMLAPKYK